MNPQATKPWSRLVSKRVRKTGEKVTVLTNAPQSRRWATAQSGFPWPREMIRTRRRAARRVRYRVSRVKSRKSSLSSGVSIRTLLRGERRGCSPGLARLVYHTGLSCHPEATGRGGGPAEGPGEG